MDRGYSLYLDVLRFSAAMVVFFSHVASQDLTNGFLWQFKAYSQTAVMIFFVMSGYVIAFVTNEKEKNITDFAVARVSRLWSIVIPALILTAVCDYIGLKINPDLYLNSAWPYPEASQFIHYLLSFFLVQNLWAADLNPGINGPFWSLTYEWVYYILFGIFYFVKGNAKWLWFFLVAALAGPSILVLFPVWLFGYALFRMQMRLKQHFVFSYVKACLAILTIGLIIFVGPQIREIKTSISWLSRTSVLGDYFDAVIFVIHLYYCPHLIHLFKPMLIRYENIIRWSASLTFALYLFHRPIIQLVAAVYDGSRESSIYRITMVVLTFIIVATIGRWCEQNKYALKKYLHNLKF